MHTLKFDHFITSIGDEQIDPYLEEYRKAIFQVEGQTVQHHRHHPTPRWGVAQRAHSRHGREVAP